MQEFRRCFETVNTFGHLGAYCRGLLSDLPRKSVEAIALITLLKIAFTRAGVEHVFRVAKTEIGFEQFEDRGYTGLLRHMILCQLVLLFVEEQTDRPREEKAEPCALPMAQTDRALNILCRHWRPRPPSMKHGPYVMARLDCHIIPVVDACWRTGIIAATLTSTS